MTRRRWIADEVSGSHAALTGAHATHLVRVLRARIGQEFDILANGVLHRARIATIDDHRVEFDLGETIPAEAAVVQLTVLLAVFKFDRMEWAIEKVTELGVSRIIPIIVRRTDAHLAAAAVKRVERWRRLALQAAEQSRRAVPPDVMDPIKLHEAASLTGSLRVVLSEVERQKQLKDVLADTTASEILLAVGPEGGWTDDELRLFQKNAWITASLGPTILRAETAAIAAAAITVAEFNG